MIETGVEISIRIKEFFDIYYLIVHWPEIDSSSWRPGFVE